MPGGKFKVADKTSVTFHTSTKNTPPDMYMRAYSFIIMYT